MKRCLMIAWLVGAICLANDGAAGSPLMISSPYALSGMGRSMSGFRATYGGQSFGAGTRRAGFPNSPIWWQNTLANEATSLALAQQALFASDVGTSFATSEPALYSPLPGAQAISTGSNSSNASAVTAPPATPGHVSMVSRTITAASGTAGVNGAAAAFWNSASDPRLRRVFRWNEGHVLILVEDAAPVPISESPANYGDSFDAPLVVQVKQILSKQRYYGGPMDGIIGPSLHQAIEDYQADHNLVVTGGLDAGFLQSLGMLENASEIDESSVPASGD